MSGHGDPPRMADGQPRRGFVVAMGAMVGGAIALVTPLAAGLAVVLNPLRRRAPAGGERYYRVASLDVLPADGVPRQFAVKADYRDAWTFAPNQRIGAVLLRRQIDSGAEENGVQAFNVVCPHAGCFVRFNAERNQYVCPCHNSAFELDGQVIAPSPSPRSLDELAVKVEDDGSIWVAFKHFLAGRAEKVERA